MFYRPCFNLRFFVFRALPANALDAENTFRLLAAGLEPMRQEREGPQEPLLVQGLLQA